MFDYSRDQYTACMKQVFNSSLCITATVKIAYEDIGQESIYRDLGDTLDARQTMTLKKSYPEGLVPFYKVKLYPMDKGGLSLSVAQEQQFLLNGNVVPYDMWVSCFKDTVKVRQNNTIFDFTDIVQISGISYKIKGIIHDTFSNRPVLNIFLVKESS